MTPFSALFVDRDGTIIEEVGYPSAAADVRLLPGAAAALRRLRTLDIPVVVVTNQSGLGRGRFDRAAFEAVQREVRARLREAGADVDAVYVCPHAPEAACGCRKPAGGLFERAARELGLDLARGLYVGDRLRDLTFGVARGGTAVIVATGAPLPDELPAGILRAIDLSDAVERAFAATGSAPGGRPCG